MNDEDLADVVSVFGKYQNLKLHNYELQINVPKIKEPRQSSPLRHKPRKISKPLRESKSAARFADWTIDLIDKHVSSSASKD